MNSLQSKLKKNNKTLLKEIKGCINKWKDATEFLKLDITINNYYS